MIIKEDVEKFVKGETVLEWKGDDRRATFIHLSKNGEFVVQENKDGKLMVWTPEEYAMLSVVKPKQKTKCYQNKSDLTVVIVPCGGIEFYFCNEHWKQINFDPNEFEFEKVEK